MHQIPVPVLCFHQVTMPGFLQNIRVIRIGSQHRIFRIHFVWTPYRTRACHCHTVIISGTALCSQTVIPVPDMINVRSFCKSDFCSAKNIPHFTGKFPAHRIKFLYKHSLKSIPHIDQIFAPVTVMKQGWIKTGTVQINRI